MAKGKKSTKKRDNTAQMARLRARKNRRVIQNNLPKYERNEDGSLNRDKPITHTQEEADAWRVVSEKHGKFGKFANLKPKKNGAPRKKNSREEEE